MYADYEDLGLLIEMSQEEQDEETVQEIEEELLLSLIHISEPTRH